MSGKGCFRLLKGDVMQAAAFQSRKNLKQERSRSEQDGRDPLQEEKVSLEKATYSLKEKMEVLHGVDMEFPKGSFTSIFLMKLPQILMWKAKTTLCRKFIDLWERKQ